MEMCNKEKIKRIITILVLLLVFSKTVLFAERKLSIGIGYPYLSAKYNFSPKIASEFRFATGEGINVFAGKGYYNFYKLINLNAFTGLEVGYITFDILEMKGTGYLGSIFIGGEYFITDRLSLALDLSPTLISLKSDGFGVAGIEIIANLAIYYHFFKRDYPLKISVKEQPVQEEVVPKVEPQQKVIIPQEAVTKEIIAEPQPEEVGEIDLRVITYTAGTWEDDRDCLWNIAAKKSIYGDPWKWKKIYNANRDKIKDPNLIFPNQVLIIPRD